MTEAESINIVVGGDQYNVLVEHLNGVAYRVAECPWFVEEFGYDDIIELEREEAGVASFVQVRQVSRRLRSWFVLDRLAASSLALPRALDAVTASGASGKQAKGGSL